MNRNSSIAIAAAAACIVSLSSAKAYHRHATQKEVKEPYGRFSRQQILAKSEPILSALSPGGDALSTMATRASTTEQSPNKRRFWIVDGYNSDRCSQVTLIWDASTGELESVSVDRGEHPGKHSLSTVAKRTPGPLRLPDAIRISGSWLTSLGVEQSGTAWHYDNRAKRNRSSWYLLWESGRHRMEVAIDPVNGQLLLAFTIGPEDTRIGMAAGRKSSKPVM